MQNWHDSIGRHQLRVRMNGMESVCVASANDSSFPCRLASVLILKKQRLAHFSACTHGQCEPLLFAFGGARYWRAIDEVSRILTGTWGCRRGCSGLCQWNPAQDWDMIDARSADDRRGREQGPGPTLVMRRIAECSSFTLRGCWERSKELLDGDMWRPAASD